MRLQSFGDSSRSRPPPSNKSSNGSRNGQPGKPASTKNASANKDGASTSSTASASDTSGPAAASTASTSNSAARKARTQRANSRTNAGRRSRIDPFGGEGGLSSFNHTNSNDSWLPRSIKPVDVLRAHPAQISLDGFYSLNRPLLQVTVSPKQRRYPSSENNNKKTMEVVGESEFTEEQIKAGQQDPFAEDQIGEFDLHLVTEPEGADPEWAEGTDKYMASLEHNTPPPAPSFVSSPSPSTPTATASTRKPSKKQSARQEAVDFLFPIQAEARKFEAELSQSPSSSSSTQEQSLGAQIQRLLHIEGFEIDMAEGGPHSKHGTPSDPMAGSKFLTSELMKNKWSGMWEWEPTRRALVAASSTPSTASSSKGKANVSNNQKATTSIDPMQTSLDKLGKLSKAQARANARSSMRKSGNSGNAILSGSSPKNGDLLTVQNGEDLQETLQKLARDPNSMGKTIFIQMPLNGNSSTKKGKKQKKNTTSSDEEVKLDTVKEEKATMFAEEEVKQVLEQVQKFKGFFDKSVDVDLQNKAATSEGSTSAKEVSPSEVAVDAKLVGLEWDAPSTSSEEVQTEDLSWFTEERPSEATVTARYSLIGSRLSSTQAYRGRSLRPTLRERLAVRDVELDGPYKWIEMDSVKRKRRKRISKHK